MDKMTDGDLWSRQIVIGGCESSINGKCSSKTSATDLSCTQHKTLAVSALYHRVSVYVDLYILVIRSYETALRSCIPNGSASFQPDRQASTIMAAPKIDIDWQSTLDSRGGPAMVCCFTLVGPWSWSLINSRVEFINPQGILVSESRTYQTERNPSPELCASYTGRWALT